MTTLDELLNSIFPEDVTARYADFRTEFRGWLQTSRRYKAFAAEYATKIRTKLKQVRDDAGMSDLRAELATACWLLSEDRFTLVYEQYAASKQRGPDFTVTYRTHTPLNVEVRRLRSPELSPDTPDNPTGKLMTLLADKVGQMPPGVLNLLWLVAAYPLPPDAIPDAMTALRQLAEGKDDAYFTRRDFKNAAEFLNRVRHLSAIVVVQPGSPQVWQHPQARHQLPPDLVNAIRRILADQH